MDLFDFPRNKERNKQRKKQQKHRDPWFFVQKDGFLIEKQFLIHFLVAF